ncbi:MAG TPA: VIT domain-containing protein [Allosphingosinicella sp.]|jgi:tetratricopeptide (TPR) repeat protein
MDRLFRIGFGARAALFFGLVLALAGGRGSAAEPANPNLTALVRGVNDESSRRDSLRIEKLDIAVRIHGGIADTVLTARLANPGNEELEGDFGLAMPAGSTVTGYALDVDGTMVDGVLVDQRQARRAYQERVRQGVDPGLAEVLRGFQFRNRVSPIFPGKSRTIRVSFSTPLDPRLGYVLPLSGGTEVGELGIIVEVSGLAREPVVHLPDGGQARLERNSGGHPFAYARTGARLQSALAVSGVERVAPLIASRHPNGDSFFEISDTGEAQAAGPGPRRVTILWDRSLSRADDDLASEMALLKAYLERVRPGRIELILFDSSLVERTEVPNADAAARAIASTRYLGASSVAVLAQQPIEADACLLFSDGLVTLDRRDAFRPACPILAISSAPDSDRAWLGAVAAGSGGLAVQLDPTDKEAALAKLTGASPRVLAVRTAAGAPIEFTLLDSPDKGWRLVGPLPGSGPVIVRVAGADGRAADRTYAVPAADRPSLTGAGALWASERLELRSASDDADRDSLVAFARRHSVGGPEISFLVLETPRDYARNDIAPPANYAQDKRAEFDRLIAAQRAEKDSLQKARFEAVLAAWEEQKSWWQRQFDPNAKPKRRQATEGGESGGDITLTGSRMDGNGDRSSSRRGRRESPPAPEPMAEPAPPPPVESPPPPGAAEQDLNELPALRSTTGDSRLADKSIEMAPWSADRPYLKALADAPAGQLESVFAAQQKDHGGLPAFWLDVSDFYFRAGRRPEAIRLLLSAIDLPTRDSETVATVAARLVRWGELDRAVQLYERLAASEPDRPQPLRNLALALAKRAEAGSGEQARADLARAIALLAQVVTKSWPPAYDGIELIALMEANRLIPRYRSLGGTDPALDPRLIALLDVDLRVVIEWNTDATDLDLWVDEPNGERAIYSNPRTLVGGRLSKDMTRGYGPEEYLLRRAPDGTFTVRANVFAADRINPNGASRITAHLIRDFGRPEEREEAVDIEVLPREARGERLIGKIRVSR